MKTNPIALHLVNLNVKNEVLPVDWYKVKHNIKRLYIRNGNIASIESNAFNSKAFKRLYYLELDGLAIKHFKRDTFNGLVFLRILILRNLHLYKFQSNSFIPNVNAAWDEKELKQMLDFNQYSDRNRNANSKHCECFFDFGIKLNISTCLRALHLNDDSRPIMPWIVLKQLKLAVITVFLSSLFSFYIGFKLAFKIVQMYRKLSRQYDKFIQNLENDAVSIFIKDNTVSQTTVKRIRKLTLSE